MAEVERTCVKNTVQDAFLENREFVCVTVFSNP